jgi:cytochrome c oxidase subunit 1
MGAVFAIFMAIYFWLTKLTTINVSVILGQIHFWITFVGVNLTFFPMHFLGLAGMPRRIPDYPEAFLGWNQVASVGSYVTLVGLLVFMSVFSYTQVAGRDKLQFQAMLVNWNKI